MTAKYDFSTKEGKNQYQRDYYKNNPEQKEKQIWRVKRNKRNKINGHKCLNSKDCVIKLTNGVNKSDCIGCEHYTLSKK